MARPRAMLAYSLSSPAFSVPLRLVVNFFSASLHGILVTGFEITHNKEPRPLRDRARPTSSAIRRQSHATPSSGFPQVARLPRLGLAVLLQKPDHPTRVNVGQGWRW